MNIIARHFGQDISEQLESEHPGKERLKPVAKYLREISCIEKTLSSHLAKGLNDDSMKSITDCRNFLQVLYEKIILADPTYCAEKNLEQRLWKSVFYQFIELYRKKLKENPSDKEVIKENILKLIAEGTSYYEALIGKLEDTYEFNLNKIMKSNIIDISDIPERIRVVLKSLQKLHIYLGDLARCKHEMNQAINYAIARSYYLKASKLDPENGMPYFKIAEISSRRKLDAVHYYVRSLSTSNPILSAKQSLLTLFEEVETKNEIYLKKMKGKEKQNTSKHPEGIRTNPYFKPAVKKIKKSLDNSEEKNLSDVELNNRFVTSFLNVHGKLYSKHGMATFFDTLQQMLKDFNLLLQRTPLPLTSNRLMVLLEINIFSVDNASSKENGREHGAISLLQEQALCTCNAMMSLLMERCHKILIDHKSYPEYSYQNISDAAELLRCVKIWTDWMSCRKSYWFSTPNSVLKELNDGSVKNVWHSFADLYTSIKNLKLENCKTSTAKDKGYDLIKDNVYVNRTDDENSVQHSVRRIQCFGDYLREHSPQLMEFDIHRKKFVTLVHQVNRQEAYEGFGMQNAVLPKNKSKRTVDVRIEKYFILDTNCFIRYPRLSPDILEIRNWKFIVPLIVLRELHGLARGAHPKFGDQKKREAQEAIEFLEYEFSKEKPSLEALTSQGCILDTIKYMYEDIDKEEGTTNDDLILKSCLYYREKISLNSYTGAQEEIVLVTRDREFREKAEAKNLKVADFHFYLHSWRITA